MNAIDMTALWDHRRRVKVLLVQVLAEEPGSTCRVLRTILEFARTA
jgi:hypothetical protein